MRSYKISDEASTFITSASDSHFPNETGGVLVGKIEGSCVIIQYAIGPGPKAQHGPTRFRRDGNFSQEALDELVQSSAGEHDYIGEWHSHPTKSPPSLTDILSMKWIALNTKYATSEPVMLLCMHTGHVDWQLACYSLFGTKLRRLKRG